MGVLASGEVFFKSAESSFNVTIVVPLAGTYQVALVGRAGSKEPEFAESESPLCTHKDITSARSTNSFYVCASDPLNTLSSNFGVWERDAGCTRVDARDIQPEGAFDMNVGVNTLWLTARHLCALASHLSITPPPPPSPPAPPPSPRTALYEYRLSEELASNSY